MIALAYILSGLSLLMSVLFLIKLKKPTLVMFAILAGIAGALSPYWAIMGVVGAVIGGIVGTTWAIPIGVIGAGYIEHLCPSHDNSILRIMADNPEITEEEKLRLNPYGYLYIKKVVFPQLRELGVSEESLNSLCVDGPRNFFEGV